MEAAGQSDTAPVETSFGAHVRLRRVGRIAEVTFDRGDGRNALALQDMRNLRDAALWLAEDTESSVVVLTGAGAFSAGADLADPALATAAEQPLLERRAAFKAGPDMCQAWADLEQITIAAIEGHCIGGGLALAVSCDHRVMAEGAHLRLPEIPLGMNMSWRSVPRVTALLGPARAKELIILGRKLDAATALDWGLADRKAAQGAALAGARALASDYAALPPLALRMSKQAIDVSAQPLGYATSFMDRDQFLLTRGTRDQAEAIAAFMEKRPARFSGD
ncbi:MAG: enoyl-CoA hydratase/isomerase family protein [Pseudomonadota bacterium]